MRRILAQTRKELTQILRDRLALILALVLPLILLCLLGSSISLTARDVPVVVRDLDDSLASHTFLDQLRQSISFHVVAWDITRQPEEVLIAGAARAAIVIPRHFGRDMARGLNTEVQILIDATDSNTARLVSGYALAITRAFNERDGGAVLRMPVRADIRLWYNPGRDSMKFYGPGIFVVGISMFPPLLAALAMAREGEQKTILQVYVSNISAHEFLLGKIFSFTLVALAECLLGFALLFTLFGLSFAGDPTPWIAGTILYCVCVTTFGTLIGAAIPNQAAAIQAVQLGGFLLVFLLSGLIFPVENIPPGLHWISNIVWARYYIEILRDAVLVGAGWGAMWYRVVMIGVIGAAFYVLAWRSMRRMQLRD